MHARQRQSMYPSDQHTAQKLTHTSDLRHGGGLWVGGISPRVGNETPRKGKQCVCKTWALFLLLAGGGGSGSGSGSGSVGTFGCFCGHHQQVRDADHGWIDVCDSCASGSPMADVGIQSTAQHCKTPVLWMQQCAAQLTSSTGARRAMVERCAEILFGNGTHTGGTGAERSQDVGRQQWWWWWWWMCAHFFLMPKAWFIDWLASALKSYSFVVPCFKSPDIPLYR